MRYFQVITHCRAFLLFQSAEDKRSRSRFQHQNLPREGTGDIYRSSQLPGKVRPLLIRSAFLPHLSNPCASSATNTLFFCPPSQRVGDSLGTLLLLIMNSRLQKFPLANELSCCTIGVISKRVGGWCRLESRRRELFGYEMMLRCLVPLSSNRFQNCIILGCDSKCQ